MPQHRFGGQIEAELGLSVAPGVTAPVNDLLVMAGSPYTMSVDDSGKTFLVAPGGAGPLLVALPTPVGNPGLTYRFVASVAGGGAPADNVVFTCGGALFRGTIVNGFPATLICTGTTLTMVGNLYVVGDSVEFFSAGGIWCVRAVTSVNVAITIA